VPRASDSTVLTMPTEERTKRAGGHSSVSVLPFRSSLLRMRTVALVSSSSLSPSAVGSGGVPTHLPKQASRNVRVCPGAAAGRLLHGIAPSCVLETPACLRVSHSTQSQSISISHYPPRNTHPPKNTHCVRGSKGGCIQPRQASGNLTAATPLASKEKSVHILGIRACALRWTVRRRPLRDRPSRARGGANQPPSPRCACVTEDLVVGPSCASCVRV